MKTNKNISTLTGCSESSNNRDICDAYTKKEEIIKIKTLNFTS